MTAYIKMSIFIAIAGFRQKGAICLVVAPDKSAQAEPRGWRLAAAVGQFADLQLSFLLQTCASGRLSKLRGG